MGSPVCALGPECGFGHMRMERRGTAALDIAPCAPLRSARPPGCGCSYFIEFYKINKALSHNTRHGTGASRLSKRRSNRKRIPSPPRPSMFKKDTLA